MGGPKCRATLYNDEPRQDSNEKITVVAAANEFNEVHTNGYCAGQNRNDINNDLDNVGNANNRDDCKNLCRQNKNVNEYYGCEYKNNNGACWRHNNPDLWTSRNQNSYECYINRPYLKEDHLNSFTKE